ncbi:MAG: ATPase [Candidatus Alectryocaccobium sp.]|jgi:vacuolar-type H+-ATPase subunit H|nr:ATPase [Lachnospiraceae bacterium]MDY6221223.1 ATPase [Candidatus Alectryocaccobium sp.]
MSSSRIEQIIEEIEEFIEGCKYQPLSTTKIVVNKEELEELLRELRLKTPEEIKRYQKIISNKDAILTDAQEKGNNIITEAQAKANEMVSQTEIMKQAYIQASDTVNAANQQAQEILDSAQQDANNIRLSAVSYTDELLSNISDAIGTTLADVSARNSALLDTLQQCRDVVNQNRSELSPTINSEDSQEQPQQQEYDTDIDSDYIDEDDE